MALKQEELLRRRAASKSARETGTVPVIDDAVIEAPPVQPEAQIVRAAPATSTSGRVALPMAGVDRARTLTERDLIMPKLKIAQGLSKVVQSQDVRLGNWYHTTRNEDLGAEVLFVPVDMRMSRSLWINGQGVVCRSFDMVQGEGTPGIACEGPEDEWYMPERDRGCVYRLWTKDESTGKSKKPPCGINYNFFGLVMMDGTLDGRVGRALLTLRGTASRTAKEINSLVAENSVDVREPEWSNNVIKIRLESRSNSYGTFGVPFMQYVGPTPERVMQLAANFRETVNPSMYRATIEADAGDDD